jgi:hypothetical protein
MLQSLWKKQDSGESKALMARLSSAFDNSTSLLGAHGVLGGSPGVFLLQMAEVLQKLCCKEKHRADQAWLCRISPPT